VIAHLAAALAGAAVCAGIDWAGDCGDNPWLRVVGSLGVAAFLVVAVVIVATPW